MLTTSVTNYTHIPYTPPPGFCSTIFHFLSNFLVVGREASPRDLREGLNLSGQRQTTSRSRAQTIQSRHFWPPANRDNIGPGTNEPLSG
jgi:hypothetical protein